MRPKITITPTIDYARIEVHVGGNIHVVELAPSEFALVTGSVEIEHETREASTDGAWIIHERTGRSFATIMIKGPVKP